MEQRSSLYIRVQKPETPDYSGISALDSERTLTAGERVSPGAALLNFRYSLYCAKELGCLPSDEQFEVDTLLAKQQTTGAKGREVRQREQQYEGTLCFDEHAGKGTQLPNGVIVPSLRNLLGETDFESYQLLSREIITKSRSSKGTHQFVDPSDESTQEAASELFDSIRSDLSSYAAEEKEDHFAPLEQTFHTLLESTTAALNTKNVRADLRESEKNNYYRRPGPMAEELASRYPLAKREARNLVNMNVERPRLTLWEVGKEVVRILHDNDVNKIALGAYALIRAAEGVFSGWTPLQTREIIKTKAQSLIPIIQRFGLTLGAENGYVFGERGLHKQLSEVESALNRKFLQALMYGDPEVLRQYSPAELEKLQQTGVHSSVELLETMFTKMIPNMTLTAAPAIGLSAISPWLGAITVAGAPLTYAWQRFISVKQQAATESVQEHEETSAKHTHAITLGLSGIRTTPNPQVIEDGAMELYRQEAEAYHRQKGEVVTQHSIGRTPSMLLGTSAAGAGVHLGLGTPEVVGAIYCSTMLTFGYRAASENSTALYTQVQKSQRYRKFLERTYDPDNAPNGKKDEARVPVGSDVTITFKNVRWIVDSRSKTGPERAILRGVNCTIPKGSSVALYGPNGEGKTTILRLIAGLAKPSPVVSMSSSDNLVDNDLTKSSLEDEGKILVGGIDLQRRKQYGKDGWRNKVAYAEQFPYFAPNKSLLENLAPSTTQDDIPDMRIKVERLLDVFNLGEMVKALDKPFTEASGGQKKRLGIIRAMLQDDALVYIFDEPTSGVDQENVEKVIAALQEFHAAKPDVTMIFSTHESAILDFCTKKFNISELNRTREFTAKRQKWLKTRRLARVSLTNQD